MGGQERGVQSRWKDDRDWDKNIIYLWDAETGLQKEMTANKAWITTFTSGMHTPADTEVEKKRLLDIRIASIAWCSAPMATSTYGNIHLRVGVATGRLRWDRRHDSFLEHSDPQARTEKTSGGD